MSATGFHDVADVLDDIAGERSGVVHGLAEVLAELAVGEFVGRVADGGARGVHRLLGAARKLPRAVGDGAAERCPRMHDVADHRRGAAGKRIADGVHGAAGRVARLIGGVARRVGRSLGRVGSRLGGVLYRLGGGLGRLFRRLGGVFSRLTDCIEEIADATHHASPVSRRPASCPSPCPRDCPTPRPDPCFAGNIAQIFR